MREASIEQSLRLRLKKMGCLFYKFVSPGNAGVPDRICVTPSGQVIFVELKTTRGRLRPEQIVQIRNLEKNNARTYVIYGPDNVDTFIRMVELIEEAQNEKRVRYERR